MRVGSKYGQNQGAKPTMTSPPHRYRALNYDGLSKLFICFTRYSSNLYIARRIVVHHLPSVVIPSDLLSSDAALLGCPRLPSSAPTAPPPPPPLKNLDASKDLCPGTYLALERQNLHRPGFFLPPPPPDDDDEVATAAAAAAAAASFCCNWREIV